ncbi:hypothetical protein [Pseudogemmobacter faecipullorum]|uniref:Uncharacterized protein n=1 Tax=Pseudogemmobacter faecipullorum TaxID=2755041 RepID=A0ABS8CIN7_9RHOB|nr:hypothetical protein [Pseudogemmobacter faecipullorum]MCB5409048.1 hypothetical protein [Pseudogemmobacter faecipullorum]
MIAARSTQHAARSTQHAARSTQHAARSTQPGRGLSSLLLLAVTLCCTCPVILSFSVFIMKYILRRFYVYFCHIMAVILEADIPMMAAAR